jgi:hypothetical protein
MRKHKKTIAPDLKEPFIGASGNHLSAQSESDFAEFENRLAGDEGSTSGKAKKEISGGWILAFLVLLLILLLVQHWLRQ